MGFRPPAFDSLIGEPILSPFDTTIYKGEFWRRAVPISPQKSLHATTADLSAFGVQYHLTAQDATHAHSAEQPTVAVGLGAQDSTHALTSDVGPVGSISYLYGENIAGNTFSTSFEDAVTLNGATLKPNTDYFLFASSEVDPSATTFNYSIQLRNNATVLCSQNPTEHEIAAGDSPHALHYIRKVTTSNTPSSDNWTLRILGDGVNNVTYANARLVLLEVGAADAYAENHSRQTWTSPTSLTAQTAVSLNFTPPSTGTYLILGFLMGDIGSNNTHAMSMTDGTHDTGAQAIYTVSGVGERVPSVLGFIYDYTGATTVNLWIWCDSTGATLGATDACILALRLDRFHNVYGSTRSSANSNATGARMIAPGRTAFTPNAGDHLTLAFGHQGHTTTNTGNNRVNDNGTILVSPNFHPQYSSHNIPFFTARIANLSAVQRNQKIEILPSSGTASVDCPSIVTLDLTGGPAAPGSVAVRGHAIASGSGSSLVLTLPAGCQAGDTCVLFTGHGFAPNGVSGWDFMEQQAGSNWNGAYYIKELSAGDISTGSVTITYGGSFNGVRACIVFAGTPTCLKVFESSRNSTGATTRTITIGNDANIKATDYFIGFASGRGAVNVTCDSGSQLRQVNATNASGALYGGVMGADGGFTVNFFYSSAPTGDFQAVVVMSP